MFLSWAAFVAVIAGLISIVLAILFGRYSSAARRCSDLKLSTYVPPNPNVEQTELCKRILREIRIRNQPRDAQGRWVKK